MPRPLRVPATPSVRTPKPRVTATEVSPWLRALPHGFAYRVPIDAWWRVSYVLDDTDGRRCYLRQRLPSTLTEAEFFRLVARRAGRYYFEPVDAASRRFVDTRLAYFDVTHPDVTHPDVTPAPPRAPARDRVSRPGKARRR